MDIILRFGEDEDGSRVEDFSINGQHAETVRSLYECPEDAIIGRDLISCGTIVDYMELAYNAGKNGDPFTVTKQYIVEQTDY